MPGHAGAEASTSAPTGLALATPGGRHAEAAAGAAAAEKASRAFGFPYQTAYDIQIQLMQAVFRAIEGGQIGVFESPTGTVCDRVADDVGGDGDRGCCTEEAPIVLSHAILFHADGPGQVTQPHLCGVHLADTQCRARPAWSSW